MWWLAPALLAACVLASPGLARAPLTALALVAIAALGVLLRSSRSFARMPLVVIVGLALAGATLLQLLPLPAGLVAALAPHSFELASETHQVLGLSPPAWLALSSDPHSTALELVKLIGLTSVALVFARLAASSGGRLHLLRAIGFVGAACGALALGHYLFSATELFGIYQPFTSAPLPFLSPLINPNHLSALMIVTTSVALALAVRSTTTRARAGWIAAAAFATTLCLLLRSRAALLLLPAAGLSLLFLLWRRSRKRTDRGRPLLVGIFIAACLLSMLAALLGDELAYEFLAQPLLAPEGRPALWNASLDLALAQPLIGIGRGAFEASIARVYPSSHLLSYSFAENQYLQLVVDFGLPLSLLLGFLLLKMTKRALRHGADDTLAAAAAVALVALLVHALVDFGLETPGLAACAIALVCVLDRPELVTRARPRWQGPLWIGTFAMTAALALWARPLREDRKQLFDEQHARAAMLRHPADYVAPATVASHRFAAGDRRGFAFANHALQRQPQNPHVHHLVARMLVAAGRPFQACIEYRLAAEASPSFASVMREVVARYQRPAEIARCLPLRAVGPLSPVAALAGFGQGEAALLLARRGEVERSATDPADLLLLAELETLHGSKAAGRNALDRALPGLTPGYDLVRAGRVLARVGDAASAMALFDRALGMFTESKIRAQIHRERAALHRAAGQLHQADWEETQAKQLSP